MLSVTACSNTPPTPSSAAPEITVSYAPGTPPAIDVTAAHALALSTAELVTRDGQVLRSAAAEREPAPGGGYGWSPSVGVGVFGGSSSGIGTGIGLGFPLGGYAPSRPTAIRARAKLAIEDVDAYRRDWPDLLVRLRFGTPPGDTSTAEIPAPAPR